MAPPGSELFISRFGASLRSADNPDYEFLTAISTRHARRLTLGRRNDAKGRARKMRILVVEDNDQLVVLRTRALAKAGLDVDSARTVADTEASLRTVSYAAVVLDLGLPDADGRALLDQMRRRRDQTP